MFESIPEVHKYAQAIQTGKHRSLDKGVWIAKGKSGTGQGYRREYKIPAQKMDGERSKDRADRHPIQNRFNLHDHKDITYIQEKSQNQEGCRYTLK